MRGKNCKKKVSVCFLNKFSLYFLFGNNYNKIKGGDAATDFDRFFNSRLFKFIILALWLAVILICLFFSKDITVEKIIDFTPENKIAAAGIMMFLFALKSLSVVVYSGILFAALGVMFELPYALILAVCGSAVIAMIPYFIGRKLGTGQIERLDKKYPRLRIIKAMRTSNVFMFVLLTRLLGVLPFDIVSLYMGTAGIKFKSYILGSVLGMLQLSIPMTVMGYAIDDPDSPTFIISGAVQLFISVASFIGMYFFVRRTKKNSVSDF